MVPEFLELGIFGSLINRRCHFLEMQIGLESYGFARKKVPLQKFLHHPSVPSLCCGFSERDPGTTWVWGMMIQLQSLWVT